MRRLLRLSQCPSASSRRQPADVSPASSSVRRHLPRSMLQHFLDLCANLEMSALWSVAMWFDPSKLYCGHWTHHGYCYDTSMPAAGNVLVEIHRLGPFYVFWLHARMCLFWPLSSEVRKAAGSQSSSKTWLLGVGASRRLLQLFPWGPRSCRIRSNPAPVPVPFLLLVARLKSNVQSVLVVGKVVASMLSKFARWWRGCYLERCCKTVSAAKARC